MHSHRQLIKFVTILFMVWPMIVVKAYPPPQPQVVEVPAQEHSLTNYVPRATWDYKNEIHQTPIRCGAKHVAIVQTDTELCVFFENCAELLYEIEREAGGLLYNFVLTPDGYIYEVLGWAEPSPMFIEVPTMVVAFLGKYADMIPTDEQLNQLRALLSTSEEMEFLANDYIMFGKKTKEIPVKLYECLAPWSQWDFEISDADLIYVDNVPYYVYEI